MVMEMSTHFSTKTICLKNGSLKERNGQLYSKTLIHLSSEHFLQFQLFPRLKTQKLTQLLLPESLVKLLELSANFKKVIKILQSTLNTTSQDHCFQKNQLTNKATLCSLVTLTRLFSVSLNMKLLSRKLKDSSWNSSILNMRMPLKHCSKVLLDLNACTKNTLSFLKTIPELE